MKKDITSLLLLSGKVCIERYAMRPYSALAIIILCALGNAQSVLAAGHGASSRTIPAASLAGSNVQAADAMERNQEWLNGSAQHKLFDAYQLITSSSSLPDINDKMRGLTPHGTTLLAPMGINRFDMIQSVLFDNMAKKNLAPALDDDSLARTVFHPLTHVPVSRDIAPADYFSPLVESQSALPTPAVTASSLALPQWSAWLTPLSGYERYDAKSQATANASASTMGAAFGTVNHRNDYSFGLSGFFLRSSPSGGGWLADTETLGVMAGLDFPAIKMGILTPHLQVGLAYAYSDIAQQRKDMLGHSHDSSPEQHGVRITASAKQNLPICSWLTFTPLVGMDYTYISQDGYTEDGNGLPLQVSGASMHSLRPRLGVELNFTAIDNVTITTHAYFRHELADRSMSLSSRIMGSPVIFTSRGDKYSRSGGSGGVRFSWQAADDISIGAHYNIIVGDRYPGHYTQAAAPMNFDGESYDGSSGNGGVTFSWQISEAIALNANYDAVFDGDAPGSLMNAVLTWEF